MYKLINKVFEYNQHFIAMMNIINVARLNPPESGHKHHIIPKCWFKMNNLPIDNSDDNLVLLTEEHRRKLSESQKGRVPWNKGMHQKEIKSR